jgi:hypothetical protein
MVEFQATNDRLYLLYTPRDEGSWVFDKFDRGEELVIKNTFHVARRHLIAAAADENEGDGLVDDHPLRFVVATGEGDYFRFDPDVLPVGCPVLLARNADPSWKWFTAEQRTSILDLIAELKPTRIVIGGSEPDAIPLAEYQSLIERFPTSHELKRYVRARVAAVVREYSDAQVDAEALFRSYVGKRLRKKVRNFRVLFRADEERKYRYLHGRLTEMLASEDTYSEAAWQAEILQIVLLLNPRYIAAFERAPVKDFDRGVMRELDILLVDASGSIDVIEIKQPFGKSIVTTGVYRDNHIPLRELSGSVMQLEKYIFHLNRWGPAGEAALSERFADKLPPGFQIRITNPCGIVILGRDNALSVAQRRDFEVVRRKYKNVVDIITYDDLLRRLESVLSQLKAQA